jgi:hypothetical protein
MRSSVALKQNAPLAGRFVSGINVGISRKRRYGRIAAAWSGVRMMLPQHVGDFLDLVFRDIHHQENFAVLDFLEKFLKVSVGFLGPAWQSRAESIKSKSAGGGAIDLMQRR